MKRVRKSDAFDHVDFRRKVPALRPSKALKSDKPAPKPGPQQLPHGNNHRIEIYMRSIVNIEVMTYSGNPEIVPFVLNNFVLESGYKHNRLVIGRKLP